MIFYRSQPLQTAEDYEFPWQVPGGLHKSTGWRSFVAVSWQPEPWNPGEPYKNGTTFLDMLVNSTTEKVFTLRVRSKAKGVWTSAVAYKDQSQYPVGFAGAGALCSECHAARSAPRAKDTVISFSR